MKENDEAEMGIGTMIIFIAMVIVAAVAATLLISTASWVQQQAQETGRIAIQDVATGFKIIHIQGDRHADGSSSGSNQSTIQIVEIKVALEAGSPSLNLSNVIIEVTDGDTEVTLSYNSSASSPSDLQYTANNKEYMAAELRDPDGQFTNSNPIVTQGAVLWLKFDAADAGLNLDPQTKVTIHIIPKHGVPTYEWFETPAVYTSRYVQLV
ncbi:MAG: flagellin [Thermoproteota archaeon]|nr:MAG: flagellin [Candidatus Korarchaeota archaeon]